MIFSVEGKIGAIPVSLKIEVDSDQSVLQALQSLSARVASTGVVASSGGQLLAMEPATPQKRKRRKPVRRITKTDDGRVEVSSPEMTMLKSLPANGSAMNLQDLAEKVWPGRKAPNGGPLVGPAARVAGGLRAKGLATIEGKGGDKTVTVDVDWQKKAVEEQK